MEMIIASAYKVKPELLGQAFFEFIKWDLRHSAVVALALEAFSCFGCLLLELLDAEKNGITPL